MRSALALVLATFFLTACTTPLAVPDLDYAKISDEVVVVGDLQGGHGSGVLISADVLILTNGHVADHADSHDEMQVQFRDGTGAVAKVVWNAGSGSGSPDVALLRIENPKQYPFAEIGTEKLYVGQPVFAIGNPIFFGWTITWGHISAFHRDLSSQGSAKDLIQTDLSIEHGSSGGGLFDKDGKLIGLPNAADPGNAVISFAVARDTLVEQLALHTVP